MARRPIFIPKFDGPTLVEETYVDFKWNPGLAVSQKMKNIVALHNGAKEEGFFPLLEVSSKSEENLGISLSAFNLKFHHPKIGEITIEGAFQGSKVFEFGGPYADLYQKSGGDIKKDLRLKNSGKLVKFRIDESDWALKPRTAFYDWIYINALVQKKEIANKLLNYQGFTDIEFNPKKSINCQARSCALYVSLVKRGKLEEALSDRSLFCDILGKANFDDFDLYDQ